MRYLITTLLLTITLCSTPARKNFTLPEEMNNKQSADTRPQQFTDSLQKALLPTTTPVKLDIANWTGTAFYVLPKQELIQSAGYNISTCIGSDCTFLPVNPAIELANRRLRCSALESDTLTVSAVLPDTNEWIITFISAKTGSKVYAKTHMLAIQEIVRFDDLAMARKRWLNCTVFSRRGTILVLNDKSRSSITSQRVNLLDSLTVNDVTWGVTPLPVKPIWLSVTVKNSGKKGFIPIRYSWTNTFSTQITEKQPWTEDIFEEDPRALFDWDEYTWEVINNHRVILEMTPEQVELSWGAPVEIATNLTSKDTMQYTYPSHILVFEQDKLVSINER